MYARGKTGRLERTLRTFSTIAGVPSVVSFTGFMLPGGQTLRLVNGHYYRHRSGIPMLLSAAKVAAVCSMTGHHKQMPQVGRLTCPLFMVGALRLMRDYGPMKAAVITLLRT